MKVICELRNGKLGDVVQAWPPFRRSAPVSFSSGRRQASDVLNDEMPSDSTIGG